MKLNPFSKPIAKTYRSYEKKFYDECYEQRLEERLFQESVFYSQKTHALLPNIYPQPLFYGEKVEQYLQGIVDETNDLFHDVYKLLLRDQDARKYLGVSKTELDYIGKDKNPAKVFRIDTGILRETKELKIIEFNTNSPGGFPNIDGIEKAVLEENPYLHRLKDVGFEFSRYHRMDEFSTLFQKEPLLLLGVVSSEDYLYDLPLLQLQREFEKRDIPTQHTFAGDPQLRYTNNQVLYRNSPISQINRRVVSKQDANKIKHLSKASKEGNLNLVNSNASRVLGLKKLFALLHNSYFSEKLSLASREFIEEYIPKTYDLRQLSSNDLEQVISQRENYVVKKDSSAQGNGVYIGKEFIQSGWEEKLKYLLSLKKHSFLLQEFMDFTQVGGKVYDYSLLSINGEFSPFVRIAKDTNSFKTNIAQGGYYVPCFKYRKK